MRANSVRPYKRDGGAVLRTVEDAGPYKKGGSQVKPVTVIEDV